MKYQKNKKAAFHVEVITQFLSFVALILLLIIFATLFNLKGCGTIDQKIGDKDISLDSNLMLLNYLRTPVGDDTIADIISTNSGDYKLIQEKTKEVFKDFEGVFEVLVNIDHNTYIFDCGTTKTVACNAKKGLSTAYLPDVQGVYVNVSLCYWKDLTGKTPSKNYDCRVRKS